MKRISALISVVLLTIMLSCSMSFAAGLELVSSTPADGDSGLQPINLMVKLQFNENMNSKEAQEANKNAFTIKDEKGNKLKYTALYRDKNPNEIWVLLEDTTKLGPNVGFTFQINEGLKASSGHTLDKAEKLEYKIRDTKMDNTVYMGMMVVMVVAMVFFTSRTEKKKQEKQALVEGEKVNPYKVAKEKGMAVEEVVEKTEKERAKQVKKAGGAPRSTRAVEVEEEEQPKTKNGLLVLRVKAKKVVPGEHHFPRTTRKNKKQAPKKRPQSQGPHKAESKGRKKKKK